MTHDEGWGAVAAHEARVYVLGMSEPEMTPADRDPAEGQGTYVPSGLAASIRSLFDESPVTERQAAVAAARDRFTTRVSGYLHAGEEERQSLVPGILEDAKLLRGPDDLRAVGDAVIALVRIEEDGENASAIALASELLDSHVTTSFAARLGIEKNPEVRQPLMAVCLRLPSLLAPALTGILAEAPDRGARRALMDVIANMGEYGHTAGLELLEDPRWYTVRNGVILLAEIGDADTVQALTTPLANEDARVRRETVIALAKLGGEDAGLLILGMLGDASPDVRSAAAMGIGELKVMKGEKPLLELLAEEENEEVLVQVILALGQLGDPGAVSALEKRATGTLFSRPPRPVRIAAYRALAAIGTPHARSVLEAGAEDKDSEVRQAVEGVLKSFPRATAPAKAEDGGESTQAGDDEAATKAGDGVGSAGAADHGEPTKAGDDDGSDGEAEDGVEARTTGVPGKESA